MFVLCCFCSFMLVLSFCKRMLPIAWNMKDSLFQGSDLWESIYTETKSCRTENNIYFFFFEVTGTSDLWGQLQQQRIPTPKIYNNLLHPSLTLLLKVLCWNTLRSLGFGGHQLPVSSHGPAINLPLLQTPLFQYCLASLCTRHTKIVL